MSDFNYEEALKELDKADAAIARMQEAINQYSANIAELKKEPLEKFKNSTNLIK